MDKLERALEKARQQRGKLFGSLTGESHAQNVNDFAGGNVRSFITPPMPVDETQLTARRIIAHRTRNAEADVFRLLRTQVLQIMNKEGYRTLAITSPHYGDGKTTISLNLALSIALDLKQTVLLVDLDLRRPNLHEFLGLPPSAGLSDYLVNNTPVAECLKRLTFDRLSILPAGTPLDNSSELLGSPKMAALARELKARYPDRMIIYDTPPTLSQDDALAFLPHVDATLVVVQDGATTVDDLKTCLGLLRGANIIGTVLNNKNPN
jgi:protein-tyrosine kinase